MYASIKRGRSPVEFKASFRDNFTGWQQVALPFAAFQGSDGASPDLTKVHSVGFKVLGGMRNPVQLDRSAWPAPTR